MPGRSLRSTRKGKDANQDWSKLNEGSPLPDEVADLAPTASSKKSLKKKKKAAKKQQQKQPSPPPSVHDVGDTNDDTCSSGAEMCDEMLLLDNNPSHSVKYSRNGDEQKVNKADSSDDDDEEIQKAKDKLTQLQKKDSRRRREGKLLKLAEETKRLERSLKKSKKPKRHVTTTADLRSMSDVVAKVDKLMDAKKLNFKESSNSSDSDSPTTTDSTANGSRRSSSSDEERRVKKREKKVDKKKKSGKESKLTSDVKFPQTWPHSTLKFHFVGKEKKYDDLTLAEFCAGSMSILLKTSRSSEKKARIQHLEELMYLATHKSWKSVLNYHGACLLEIERGNLKWGDNFQLQGLHSTIFNAVGQNPPQQRHSSGKQSSPTNPTGGNERICFCKGYQKGNCSYTRDHYGYLMGANQLLRHICAKCWLALKKQSPHPENSDECPIAGVEL